MATTTNESTYDVTNLCAQLGTMASEIGSMNVTLPDFADTLKRYYDEAVNAINQFSSVERMQTAVQQAKVAMSILDIPAKDMAPSAWRELAGISANSKKRSGGIVRGRWNVEFGDAISDSIDLLENATSKKANENSKRGTRSVHLLRLACYVLIAKYLPWANEAPDGYDEDDKGRATYLPDGTRLDGDKLDSIITEHDLLNVLLTIAGNYADDDELKLIIATRLGNRVYTQFNPVKRQTKPKAEAVEGESVVDVDDDVELDDDSTDDSE